MDGVELIKTKPVEVGILVVHHSSPFTSCRAQRIASVGRRCYYSLICKKPGRILQWIDEYVDPCQSAGELIVLSTSTGSRNSTFNSDIYGHPNKQQLQEFQHRLLQQVFLWAFQPVRWSVFSQFWIMQSELPKAGGSTTTWCHFWGTNFTGCMFLKEWSTNVAHWYTRHCMGRYQQTFDNSAPTSQRSSGA